MASNNPRFDGLNPEPAPFPMGDLPSRVGAVNDGRAQMVDPGVDPSTMEGYTSRVEQTRLAAVAMGFDWPATIVPEGSALISVGTDKLRRDRAAWERMPLAVDAFPVVREALAAERRADKDVNVAQIRIRPSDGRLLSAANFTDPNAPGLAYSPHALRQIMGQAGMLSEAPRGFANALGYISNAERSAVFNRLMTEAPPDTAKQTTLRTRLASDGKTRFVRAALSERYGDADDPTVAAIIASMDWPDGARLSYLPGDDASRFEMVMPNRLEVPNFRAGDIHYLAVHALTGETGLTAFESYAAMVRALCVNLTTGQADGEHRSVRHVGKDEDVQARVRAALTKAVAQLEPLLQTVGYSATIRTHLTSLSTKTIFERIASTYGATGAAAAAWAGTFKRAEYPETVWGLSAAITEAAHGRDSWTDEGEWEWIASAVTSQAVTAVKSGNDWASILAKGGNEARDAQRRAQAAQSARRGN